MNIKKTLKENRITKNIYKKCKAIKDTRVLKNKTSYHGHFVDRSKGYSKLCIILAGYKEYLYPAVFGRIQKYLTDDIDTCVITSGRYSEQIANLCEKNNWSYLSTEENNVSLVQNVAILKHPNAQYIYKLDEDVFITENYFTNMLRAYLHAQKGEYNPGVMGALLNVNGYAHLRILEKLGLKEVYTGNFEEPKYMAGRSRKIESDPEAAMFMWGKGGFVPTIDQLNSDFSAQPIEERPCPIRFSIGAILFERSLWEDMGFFSVYRGGSNMGMDEIQICSHCINHSRPIMVSENVVVGHLSFGLQNEKMRHFYETHPERFV